MVKNEKIPYGYIYRATNIHNGKNYIGQTVSSQWGKGKIPIEERWKNEVKEAFKRQKRGENLRDIESAVIKHGPENFKLRQQDIANNQEELNRKENYWMREYDTLNPEKGYNVMEAGRGGLLTERVKEKMSRSHEEKWQSDQVYQQKQVSERRERANNPEWIKKMAEVNQEIARNPETLKKMSESILEKWKEKEYQENVSKGVSGKWQEPKFRERQFNAKVYGRREIPDRAEFLKEIQNLNKKDLNRKYDMDGKCINDRIKDMLGHHGIQNFSQAKKYLEDKNLDNVLKDINRKLENQSQKFVGKKEITNRKEFLKDIQNMQRKDIDHKYDMNRSTVNKRIREMLGEHGVKNYTEAKKYLEGKNLDKVAKEINERLSNQSQKFEGKSIISNKREFLEDIQKLQKNEIDHKYGMAAKTVNNKIKEMLGEHGVKNYTEAKEYLKDKNVEDISKEIEKRSAEKEDDQQKSESNVEKKEKVERIEQKEESNVEKKEKVERTEQKEKSKIEEQTEGVGKESQLESSFSPKGSMQDLIGPKDSKDKEEEAKRVPKGWGLIDYYFPPRNAKEKFRKDWDHLGPGSPTGKKDYQGILDNSLNSSSGVKNDYEGIYEGPESKENDFEGIDEDSIEGGKDSDDIDDSSGEGKTDAHYEQIDEEYAGREYGGEE